MNDETRDGPTQPQSPQGRYYERYLDTEPQQTPGSGNNRRVALISGGVAAAVLLGGGGIIAATRGGSDDSAQTTSSTYSQQQSQSTGSSGNFTSGSSSTTSESSTSSSSTDPNAALAALYGPVTKPGWRIVEGKPDKANAVYDVPDSAKWQIGNRNNLIGWEAVLPGDKSVVASAPTYYDKGFCQATPSREASFVGFVFVGTRDPAEVAPDAVHQAARLLAYNKKTKKYSKIGEANTKQVMVNGGKTPAIQSIRIVQDGDPDAAKCDAKTVELRTVAFTGNGLTTMLLLTRQVDGQSKMSDADVTAIVASLRPRK